ncbi:hypothetical protein [Paucibacter soli]|uniref:hypothetical protein n=1 Tax=Paucibacter soli TaxID=3133433 RepID=UPI0030996598
MAAFKDAIAWLARTHLSVESPRKLLQVEFDDLRQRPEVEMTAALWGVRPEEVAVQVLKAAQRKVPRDWLANDKPTGRFETRRRLVERVWLLASNHRLTSEIARIVELPSAAVSRIMATGEGRPPDLILTGHFRGKVRRGIRSS